MSRKPVNNRYEFCGKVRNDIFERIGCLSLVIVSVATTIYVLKLIWEHLK